MFFRCMLAALLLLTVSAAAATAQSLSLPVELATKPRELWRSVMTGLYGPYDSTRKCWIGKKGADAFCMRPHKLNRVADTGADKLFLAIGGGPVDVTVCHVCSGNLGLIVLEKQNNKLQLVASNGLYDEVGSWSEVPPEDAFTIVKAGPDTHAWMIEAGYTAQGVTAGGKEIFAPEADKVVSLGFIATFMDNCGAVDEGEKCENYAFDLSFKPGDGPYYDVIAELAKGSDRPPAATRFEIPFDPSEKKYKAPAAMEALLEM